MLKIKKDNAPNPDGIPNRVIYLLVNERSILLVRLFDVYYRIGVHPTAFKRATTVILRKPKKADYSNPKIYRLIALLNTLGKALKAVIAERI